MHLVVCCFGLHSFSVCLLNKLPTLWDHSTVTSRWARGRGNVEHETVMGDGGLTSRCMYAPAELYLLYALPSLSASVL